MVSHIKENYENNTKEMLSLLQEGKDRKQQARAKTKRVIDNHFNNSPMLDQPNRMTNGLTLRDYLEQQVMLTWFHARHRSDPKGYFVILEPMVANIALKAGWQQNQDDVVKLNRLSRILDYIDTMYLNGKIDIRSISLDSTYEQLDAQFGNIIDEIGKQEDERLNDIDFGGINNNYQVIEDVDYDTANKYGNYSSSEGKLCYTQGEDTWEKFTNRGVNKVYLLLQNGWEEQEEVHSNSLLEQYPNEDAYDAYGLSMIFLFVDPDGNLINSNTRWNHEAKYGKGRNVDNAFTKEDLSRIIGVSFNKIFKGYTDEELKAKHINYIRLGKVQDLLDQGADPYEIFDLVSTFGEGDIAYVMFNNKYNFITKDNKLLTPNQWYDNAYKFKNGFAQIKLENKWNFIKPDGTLLSPNQWYNMADSFKNGFASVRLNHKWNLITSDGSILSPNLWFDDLGTFNEGFTWVELDKKFNFIKPNGDLLTPNQWYDNVHGFMNGFAWVALDGEKFYLSKDGVLCDMDKNPIKENRNHNKRVYINEDKLHLLCERYDISQIEHNGNFYTWQDLDTYPFFYTFNGKLIIGYEATTHSDEDYENVFDTEVTKAFGRIFTTDENDIIITISALSVDDKLTDIEVKNIVKKIVDKKNYDPYKVYYIDPYESNNLIRLMKQNTITPKQSNLGKMTMAQYHNLIYQENKEKGGNKIIFTEQQVSNLMKHKIRNILKKK